MSATVHLIDSMAPKSSTLIPSEEVVTDPSQVMPVVADDVSDGSNSSEESETEHSDGTEDEQNSPRSGDGQESDKDKDKTPRNDPGSSSSAVATGASETFTVPESFIDAVFEEEVNQALVNKDEAELRMLLSKGMNINKFYYDKCVELRAAGNKAKRIREKKERNLRKAQEKQEREEEEVTDITITVVFGETTFSMTIPKSCTLKMFRELLGAFHPKLFPSKKMLKGLRYEFAGKSIEEHARRCFGEGKGKDAGWRMVNGSVVRVSVRGLGGGKRAITSSGGKSKEESLKSLDDIINMSLLRFQSASPAISEVANQVTQALGSVKSGALDMNTLIKSLPEKDMEKLLSVTAISTKMDARCKAVSDIIFSSNLKKLNEVKNQLETSYYTLPTLTQYILTEKYGDGASNISWTSFTSAVGRSIKEHAKSQKGTDAEM